MELFNLYWYSKMLYYASHLHSDGRRLFYPHITAECSRGRVNQAEIRNQQNIQQTGVKAHDGHHRLSHRSFSDDCNACCVKCLEMTSVMIWRYTNTAELKLK